MSEDDWEEELPGSEPEDDEDDAGDDDDGEEKKKKKSSTKKKTTTKKAASKKKATSKKKAADDDDDDEDGEDADDVSPSADTDVPGTNDSGSSKTKGKRKASTKDDSKSSTPKKKAKTDKGEKVVTVNAPEAKQMIREYMLNTNRPYAHIQVFDNLHKRVKKTMVPKILDELEKENVLSAFTFGKTKLYMANQDNFAPVDQDELDRMETEIAQLTEENMALKQQAIALESECKLMENQPSDAEADKQIAALHAEMKQKSEKLDKLSNEVELIDPNLVKKRKDELSKFFREWKKRRTWCITMVEDVLGNESDQTPQSFMAEAGVEDDKEVGLDIKVFGKDIQ